jgi:hypothetical protein
VRSGVRRHTDGRPTLRCMQRGLSCPRERICDVRRRRMQGAVQQRVSTLRRFVRRREHDELRRDVQGLPEHVQRDAAVHLGHVQHQMQRGVSSVRDRVLRDRPGLQSLRRELHLAHRMLQRHLLRLDVPLYVARPVLRERQAVLQRQEVRLLRRIPERVHSVTLRGLT